MKLIPNILTSLNLLCGFAAIVAFLSIDYQLAGLMILIAAIFDFFDGFAARKLNAVSPFGAQLDSMADIVSFGFVPSLLAGMIIFRADSSSGIWIAMVAGIGVLCAAIRLAKFNSEEGDSNNFVGLPSPAYGLFWAGVVFGVPYGWQQWVLILGMIVTSLLMVLPVKMFSLKFSSMKWRGNVWRYVFLGLCILILVLGISGKTFGLALSGCIVLYVVLSFVRQLISN